MSDHPVYSWRLIHPHARILYVRDVALADNAIMAQFSETPVVGFDQEWKPSFRKGQPENPVALIQLAKHDTILLVQISAMPGWAADCIRAQNTYLQTAFPNLEFPEQLRKLLENSDVIKTGVGIQYDVKKLFRDHSISARNCVDLSLLARSVDNAQWKGKYNTPIGLARLIEYYEQMRLPKGRISRINWEKYLDDNQQEYAGNDAHAGYVLYTRLVAMASTMTIFPRSAYYTFDCIRGRLCEPSGIDWHPYNPHYDPGPPPPKESKEPKEPDTVSDTTVTAASNLQTPSASDVRIPPVMSTPRFSDTAGVNTAISKTICHPLQPSHPVHGWSGHSGYSQGRSHSSSSLHTSTAYPPPSGGAGRRYRERQTRRPYQQRQQHEDATC